MTSRTALVASMTAAALLLSAASPLLAAGTPDSKCRAAKLKSSGKYASGVLLCYAKAAAGGVAPDAECLSKASGKFESAFAAAEERNAVDCNGLDETSMAIVDETVAGVDAATPVPGGGGDCAAGVRKAAGKFASSLLKAWSKFAVKADAAAREAAVAKARGKLAGNVTKAELKTGCTAAGQGEAVRTALEHGLAPLLGCLGSTEPCVENVEEVPAGGTSTTDPDASGATETEAVVAQVETPNAGTVVLRVIETTSQAPSGYEVLGREIDITAPDATAADPLVLTFVIDASLLPPNPNTVAITRNGVMVPDCSGAPGVASPDPCVQSRTVLAGGDLEGDLEIVVLTSQASLWTPLVPIDPGSGGCPTRMLWEARADAVGDDVATEIDVGWKSGGHDMDPASGSAMTFGLDCSAGTPGNCGTCDVTGFDASSGNCRCANDPRIPCDEPLVADADDCGGSVCQCFVRVTTPVVISGTPACIYSRAAADVSGSWNVETGGGDVHLSERVVAHLGNSIESPCPTCDGDATPGDGDRGGTCSGGQSAGLSCDAHASDPTYPIPGGGFYSIDCLPSVGSNITGLGLLVDHIETTGTSTLTASLPCDFGQMCPCKVCSGNTQIACSSDAQCAAASAGTCSSNGSSVEPQPDNCNGETCVVDGNGEGECDGAGFTSYCDGYLDEEGRGIVICFDNSDCQTYGPAAGECTVLQADECFGATISATGAPDPATPRTVATTCVPPTGNGAVDNTFGLPGPGRVRTDWFVTFVE